MGRTLLRVLGFFLISTVFYGRAQELKVKPNLTADSYIIPAGGSVTLNCSVKDPADLQYELWRLTSSGDQFIKYNYIDGVFNVSEGGKYSCRGFISGTNSVTSKSDAVIINQTVSIKPTVILQPSWAQIYSGETVSLRCWIQGGDGWRFDWFRDGSAYSAAQPRGNNEAITVSQGGLYHCRGGRGGGRGEPGFYTEDSNEVPIEKTLSIKATVILQPSWAQIFRGETVTARCEIQGGGGTQWEYEWSPARLNIPPTSSELRISRVTDSEKYSCRGRKDQFHFTQWSDVITVTVSSSKPRATLRAPRTTIPAGGSVALSCSVDGSDGWRFDWFRDGSAYSAAQPGGNNEAITVSQGGLYHCRGGRGGGRGGGGRGEPGFYTDVSRKVTIKETLSIKPTVILQPSWPQIYSGETVTARCEIQGGGGTQWEYEWSPARLNIPPTSSELRVTDSGEYSCRGRKDQFHFTQWSDVITVTVSSEPRPVLTVSPSWLSPGASVTLSCQVEHPSAGWRFYWYKAAPDRSKRSFSYELLPESNNRTEHDSYIIHGQTHTAGYVCRAGRGDSVYYTYYSHPEFVWSADLHPAASLTVSPDRVQHFRDDPVSLNCEGNSTEWRVMMIKKTRDLSYCSESYWGTMDGSSCNIKHLWSDNAVFWCESGSGEFSNAVNITLQSNDGVILVSPVHPVAEGDSLVVRMGHTLLSELKFFLLCTLLCNGRAQDAVLTVQPNPMTFYIGESVTFTCDIKGGEYTDWNYILLKDGQAITSYYSNKHYTLILYYTSYSGNFHCCGLGLSTKCSKTVSISVSADKPKARLTAGTTTIPVGGSVTLSCSVESSEGWKYEWFRRTSDTSEVRINNEQNSVIRVSQGGIYRCRGLRGEPAVYTHMSDESSVFITLSNPVVATRQPSWPRLFSGETITLTCEVQGGEAAEWAYTWIRSQRTVVAYDKNWTFKASYTSSGDYTCWCRRRDDWYSSTKTSEAVTLSVSPEPRPVLTVSPSWLSPGASVTLSCQVEHPSAGWRFYWYKAVPDRPEKSYSYELLPESNNRTEHDSYIIHGQTHTAGYVCGAGRVDREYYTDYSKPKFVWSGDSRAAASLTVRPDRVQHFRLDSVSLTCGGNSTEWTVRRFPVGGILSHCSGWGKMNGSTCIVQSLRHTRAVYWCESGSAFSNAVNITAQTGDVILVTPAHPVREGDSVTLGCKLKKKELLSNVFFYKNEKLVQNDTREELIIAPVSESDEGFYKCQYSGKESLQTWMAVNPFRPESSSFLVLLVVGLVCGILMNIFLLLLCLYKQPKGPCFTRSRSSAAEQEEARHNKQPSPLHGDACVYESVRDLENVENDAVSTITDESGDVTYSSIELKTITKRGNKRKPEENTVYSELKLGSSTDLLYAQVLHHKKDTGKSVPAADETIDPDVKPGTALGKSAAMKSDL
ncbi:basement membrane-specific heparan sulfate proteoglycan core protein-like [Leuresthes tenuis]|uniref:basement membrane-specific heparan sulfate proteoglycan core protein-like n=1 Tax=Leuresthes tenuis TaxID=355514 RepID=UPI003B507DC8